MLQEHMNGLEIAKQHQTDLELRKLEMRGHLTSYQIGRGIKSKLFLSVLVAMDLIVC